MLESKVAQYHVSLIQLLDLAYRMGLVSSDKNYHICQLLQMINDHLNQEMWDRAKQEEEYYCLQQERLDDYW